MGKSLKSFLETAVIALLARYNFLRFGVIAMLSIVKVGIRCQVIIG